VSILFKLNCLAAVAALLALGPFAAYSLKISSNAALEAAKDELRLIGRVGGDALEEGYLTYVSDQVSAARNVKALLKTADRQVSMLRSDLAFLPPEISGPIEARQLSEWRRQGVAMLRLGADGRLLVSESGHVAVLDAAPDLPDLDWKNVQDMTGQNLLDKMTNGSFPPEGDFAVIRGARGSGQTALLALMRPDLSGGAFSISLASLDEVLRLSELSSSDIIRRLQDRFSSIELSAGGSMVLFGSDRSILAAKGSPPDLAPLGDVFFSRSALEGPLEEVVVFSQPTGRVLVRLQPFRPLGWTLALMAPEAEITAPAKMMAARMLTWAVLGAAAACLLSAALAKRLSGPITALARRAQEASALDFSSSKAAAFFESGPRSASDDEIGRLASAFDSMGRSVVSSVGDLLAAASARERLDGELAAARSIQLGIIPPPGAFEPCASLVAAAALKPAKEVGGDLYDYFPAPDGRLALVIGDVSGKGVPAALFMSMTVTLVRQSILDFNLSPAETMTKLNRRLSDHNPGSMFVTLLVGLFDPAAGVLEYANGGHCQPLAVGPKGARLLEGISGPMVGYLGDLAYRSLQEAVEPDETLLLYTDGVTEAQDAHGGFFGLERLQEASASAPMGPQAVARAVLSAVESFRGEAPPSDDVAILACGLKPKGDGGG
jgi:sigma-B regulation protein RsbU (phosphoserine phosphatase)